MRKSAKIGVWILAAFWAGTACALAGPLQVTPDNFKAKLLKSKAPVLLDVGATWCVPCRQMAPIIEKMSGLYSGKLLVAEMDADKNPGAVEQLNVQAFPTLIFLRGGKVVKTLLGFQREKDLRREIDLFLKAGPGQGS